MNGTFPAELVPAFAELGLSHEHDLQELAVVGFQVGKQTDLLEEFGVGPIVAATVLCAWSHPGRIHSEAAFAMLAGVAPIPANSGQVTTRYRLNRYGDRNLNTAMHTVVQSRIQYQQATRDYVARRTAEGKPAERSNAALPATSPETSTAYSKIGPQPLDEA